MYERFIDDVFDELAEEYDGGYDGDLYADVGFEGDALEQYEFDEFLAEVIDEAIATARSRAIPANKIRRIAHFSDPEPNIYIPPCPPKFEPSPDPECVTKAEQQRTRCILEASGLDPGDYRNHRVSKCNEEYNTAVRACPTICVYRG